MAKKSKFKGSDDQKYRKADARGPGPGVTGRAKIRAAKAIDSATAEEKSRRGIGESTVFGLRREGSELLGQDYGRKVGDVGGAGYYASGGKVRKMAMGGKCRGMGSAMRGGKYSMA